MTPTQGVWVLPSSRQTCKSRDILKSVSQGSRLKLLPAILAILCVAITGCASEGTRETEAEQRFPIDVSIQRLESGSALYANNCASCHGEPNISAPPIPTAPPHDESGHTWHHPDRLLFEWVLDRPPLATSMPAFRGQLTEDEILNILAYIKSTWPADIQKLQNEGSAQYEAQLREST